MGEKEKGFKSFVPEEYEQDKRRAYESLLGIADALSSGSSEEGLGQGNTTTLEVRQRHGSIAHDKHRRKRRRRREKSSSSSDRKWIRKERQRLIEAEKMAGPGKRLRQALVLQDESDLTNFIEDYKGDLGNIAFEKMLDSDVPRYRRSVLHVRGRDSSVVKNGGMNQQNDGWRRWIDTHDGIESTPCDIKSSHGVIDSVDAFIPIASKEETHGHPQGDYQGHLIERTREFNTKTRDHPHDIQLWLDFAAFQTETADILRSAGVHVSKQSYWEKRLEVLERGLQCNPGSDILTLEILHIAEKVKTPDEVNRLWRSALMSATGASSMSLWESFLERQRKHENFNAIVMSKCYLAAVTIFRREYEREEDLVSILIDCIRFHLECGFIGMGIAMIQVLLEYNVFYPEEVERQGLEQCFEKFWNSSCPLIGSENAPGWNRWYRSGCEVQEPSHKVDRNDDASFDGDDDIIGKEFDKKADTLEDEPSFEDIERWITMEMYKDSNVASSDPTSSKVAWEDIRPFAVFLKDSHSIMTILAKCMGYLGLQHVSFMQHAQVCQEQSDLSLFEMYCTPKMFRLLSSHDTILDGFSGEGENILHGVLPWWAKSPERQEFAVRLLTDIAGKLQGPLRGILMDMSIKIQLYDATRGVFSNANLQKALSFAKMVLSQQYDGILSLWGEYAFLSSLDSGGTSKMANKIFKKCMSQQRSEDGLYDAARLCHAHVKCQLLRQGLKWSILGSEFMYPACTAYMDKDHANNSIKAFFWFAGQIHQADMRQAIVQSRRVFQGLIPQCMDNHTKLAALIQTFVAFEILSGIVEDGHPRLDHALSIMHQVMMDLERKRILETEKPTIQDPMSLHILAVQQCVLACITCEMSPLALSPAEAREMVLHMLEVWPGSPLLLTSLSMMEERFNNINTLRRELRLLATQSSMQIHEHISLIALEETSPFPKARIVFEKALQQEPCRTCPIIWRLYMRKASFEYSHSIVDIFFRAVDACPWSKSVWMEGISLMTRCTAYPPKSLMETIQALREKDIPWSTEVYEILL
ncbi:hypothetical protein M9435_001050 [Picochlorum sp. BPE23]|nr:hypothetical protein M9435_001050 [Picochlorum sp. BPE23]